MSATMRRVGFGILALLALTGRGRADSDTPTVTSSIISQQGNAQSRARWATDPSYSPAKPVNVSSGTAPAKSAPTFMPAPPVTRALPVPVPTAASPVSASAASLPTPRSIVPATAAAAPIVIPSVQKSSHRGRWLLVGVVVVLIVVSYVVR